MTRSLVWIALIVMTAVALSACRTAKQEKTYTFDPIAHQRAVELRSKALALMASSAEPYSTYRGNAEQTAAEMENAYQAAIAAPDNALVSAEWASMKDPGGDLYAAFIRRWQAGRVDTATREAAIGRVERHFDYILCLEAAKRTKAGVCQSPDGAAPEPAEEASPPA